MKKTTNKDEKLYFTPKGVIAVIIATAIDMEDEPKANKKSKAIIMELSKLMAIREYGKPASNIYKDIIGVDNPNKLKDFVMKYMVSLYFKKILTFY